MHIYDYFYILYIIYMLDIQDCILCRVRWAMYPKQAMLFY